jgi:hypothetical protein
MLRSQAAWKDGRFGRQPGNVCICSLASIKTGAMLTGARNHSAMHDGSKAPCLASRLDKIGRRTANVVAVVMTRRMLGRLVVKPGRFGPTTCRRGTRHSHQAWSGPCAHPPHIPHLQRTRNSSPTRVRIEGATVASQLNVCSYRGEL